MKLSSRSQRGITLLEVIISIGILASITTGIVALSSQQSSDTRAAVTALHLKTVGDAANEYIKDNYAAVIGIATATKPALIRVSDLVAGGYLNAGYSVKNARLQDTCVLVLEPTANNLTGMVVTERGDTIDDLTLGQIAATIGAAGGGVYSTATTTFRGAMGGWSTPTTTFHNKVNNLGRRCSGSAGNVLIASGHPVMAMWFADGAGVSGTLYRDAVPSNPSLNTMNTPIIMGAGAVVTLNAACSTNGALARDASGEILSCQSSFWKKQSGPAKCPVLATGTNLNSFSIPAGEMACYNGRGLGSAPTSDWFFIEIIRHYNAGSYYQTQRAVGMTGGAAEKTWTRSQQSSTAGAGWSAWRQNLTLDSTGSAVVPGKLSVGGTTALTGAVTANGTITANSGVTMNGAVTTNSGVTMNGAVTTNGKITANNGVTIGNGTAASSTNTLVVNRTATEGAGCAPTGAVARNGVGLLLSCQSGVWKNQSGGSGLNSYAWYSGAGQGGPFTNNYGKAIYISTYHGQSSGGRYRHLYVNGVLVSMQAGYTYVDSVSAAGWVPPGATWQINASAAGTTYIYR